MSDAINNDDAQADEMSTAVRGILGTFAENEIHPGIAIDAMAYLTGRILFMACEPSQVEANIEHIKAQILSSLAAHANDVARRQAETPIAS